MTSCAKCGDCCRAIHLNYTHAEMAALENPSVRQQEDTAFVAVHWHVIGRDEAERRLPGIGYRDTGEPRFTDSSDEHFYSCDQFNPDTNECMAHDTRPPVCRDYPWYGGDERSPLVLAFNKRCSFWHDIPADQWGEGVVPLPSPLVVGESGDNG